MRRWYAAGGVQRAAGGGRYAGRFLASLGMTVATNGCPELCGEWRRRASISRREIISIEKTSFLLFPISRREFIESAEIKALRVGCANLRNFSAYFFRIILLNNLISTFFRIIFGRKISRLLSTPPAGATFL
jgi:hypothetical protein